LESFQVPQKVNDLLKDFDKPWFVAGGWAIDLYLNRVTRHHEDVEIAILRQDQLELQAFLHDWDICKVISPAQRGLRQIWKQGERLEKPVHELHANRSTEDIRELEILLNESNEYNWLFRRDIRITLPLSRMGLVSPPGIPVLSPEIVLLFKTKNTKEKDEQDFESIISSLEVEVREWLKSAMEIHCPTHFWLRRL